MRIDRHTILPYLGFILPVLFVGLLSIHTLTSIYQDIGRHITLGRIIWETKSIPSANLFSYTAPDFPFINHHWLSEVFLYWGDRLVGLEGLIVLKALILMAAFGLALAAAWRRHLTLPGIVTAFIAALILSERTDVRPEILSFLFFGWFLFVLYRAPSMKSEWRIAKFRFRTSSFLLFTLPLVQLLWVNSHIYFFMGPLVWLAFLIGRVFAAEDKKSALHSLTTTHYPLITVAIAVATLLNPHGWSGAVYPLQVFGNYGYSVMENKGPFFLAAWNYPQMTSFALYAGILLTAGSFLLNARHIRQAVFGLILTTVTAMFALAMVRNFPLFAFAMLPAVLTNLELVGWRDRRLSLVAGALVMLALVGASVATGQLYRQAHVGKQFGLIVPAGHQDSVDFFRAAAIKGPIFNNFDIGSFLIWKLPEEKVFVDGRPEAYPAGFLQDVYIKAQKDPAVFARIVDQYGINAIVWNIYDITPWSETFEARIATDPAWPLVYSGGGIDIRVRDVPQNHEIIAKYNR